MRTALIGPVYPYRGGISHYTTLLSRTLRDNGHDLLLVSFERQYPQWLFPGPNDKDPSANPLEVEEANYWLDSLNPMTWLTTFRRIREYAPDAIVLQWWTPFWAPAWCVLGMLNRLFLQAPLVYICHNVLPHETGWWSPPLAKLALRWGTDFIVQSSDEEESLSRILPRARIEVLHHPVYDIFADQRVPEEEARTRLGLPSDVPVLLFFGIVREYKGLEDLLKALPKVQARMGEVILLIAGEFWEDKQTYLRLIDELGITGSVIIEDRYIPNEKVALYLAAADILVAPYRRVTGSAVVQVARGSGCPVITTDLAGLTQAMDPLPPDSLAQPGDSRSLAETIIRHFQEGKRHREEQEHLSSSGRAGWSELADTIRDASLQCT